MTDEKTVTQPKPGTGGGCPAPWPGKYPPLINEVRTYWYGLNPKWTGGGTEKKFIVIGRPPHPVWPADSTGEGTTYGVKVNLTDAMRVVTDCIIEIYLSDIEGPYCMSDLQFNQGKGAISFEAGALSQYHNLSYIVDWRGRTHGVSFHALYRGKQWTSDSNRNLVSPKSPWIMDNVQFWLTCFPPCKSGSQPCPKCGSLPPFDPVVCNPGDDPNGGNNPGKPPG